MDIHAIMTTVRSIQAKFDTAEVRSPRSSIYMWGDGISAIRFELEYKASEGKYEHFIRKVTHDEFVTFGPDDVSTWFDEVFAEAHAWIDAIPTADERAHQAFTASLGRLIDQGRDIGIEVDFLNPLTAMMEKLATNALEDKRNS